MITDFLMEVQTMIVEKVKEEFINFVEKTDQGKEAKEVIKQMQEYVSTARNFIKGVLEACSKGKAKNINMDDVNACRLLRQGWSDVFGGYLPRAIMQVKEATENLLHTMTGNAHRVKKKAGNTKTMNNRNIFKLDIPMGSAGIIGKDRKIQPGKHEVPFEVELPDSLTSTMNIVDTNESLCQIEYHVQTTIKGFGWLWNFR